MKTPDEMRAGPPERIAGSRMSPEQNYDRQIAHWLAQQTWEAAAEICERLDRLIEDEEVL